MTTTQEWWDLLARCTAVLAACGDESAVCLTTAGRLHRYWLPGFDDDLHVAVAEPLRPGHAMLRSRRADVRAHRRQLVEGDVVVLHGVPVTSPARTWVDLAPLLSLPALVAAGDSALRAGTTAAELEAAVRRSVGGRGVRRARTALPLLDARSRSRPESHLRIAASAPDLPRWDVNVPVHRGDGGWLAEPDLSLAAAKIALEYQGGDHARLDRMRRDITRSADLRAEGWLELQYGPAEVFARPWQIGPELRAIVRRRRPELLGHRPRLRVVDQDGEWSPKQRPLGA
ncbi:hypothetical protein SAMN05443575_0457 [Jatrophihabitans endophyticus]|uniref:DUF559 domain-containing protein n=1 Tax=Jatrophihabitans endophyticus TaxID=1206085 RepID=A0A1M5D4N2_9ACTN|nr:hypothetical protein [Jatrophihabitans endophyticus]SHF62043.1 hypothetical protein SAMN05443575_0457 [Jatrophihabitans endophyticus]